MTTDWNAVRQLKRFDGAELRGLYAEAVDRMAGGISVRSTERWLREQGMSRELAKRFVVHAKHTVRLFNKSAATS